MQNLPTRFARAIREGISLDVFWYNNDGCKQHKASSGFLPMPDHECSVDDFEDWQWPRSCDRCGQSVPEECDSGVVQKISECRQYDTPSGELEPGCFYWVTWLPEDYFWENHKGPHLAVVAPNGFRWVIDGQARNCPKATNLFHRCWQWSGDPKSGNVTVYHDEASCRHDNPDIQLGTWIGRLEDGHFVQTDRALSCDLSRTHTTY